MDSIDTARDFFINQQGLSSDQADLLISKGLENYNQKMASGGRAGYQMGGLSTMSMDTGAPLQVLPQQQSMFTATGNATSSPLLNYGQTPLKMAGGGITRLNYQEGGLTDFYNNKKPIIPRIENIGGLLDQAEQSIGEPTNNITSPLANTFSGFGMRDGGIARLGYQMGGEAMVQPQMGGEMNMPQMNEQQALETIIQLLIEQGIPPEQALQLASQILQIFAQGGEPALDQFINQLEQQEQQEAQAMASGGIAGYAQRQGYGIGSFVGSIFKGVGKVVKGVANAVKSVAKSPLGRLAITIGLNMLLPGAGTAFGAAMQTAAINMGLQVIGGGKFNPLETLTAGVGAYAGAGGFGGGEANAGTATGATKLAEANVANYVGENPVSSVATAEQLTNPEFITGTITQSSIPMGGNIPTTIYSPPDAVGGSITQPGISLPGGLGFEGDISSMVGKGYAAPQPNLPFQLQGVGNTSPIDMKAVYNDYSYPSATEKFTTSASNFGTDLMNKARTGIENLSTDPLGTISNYASKAYNTVKENALTLGTGFLLGSSLGGASEEEDLSDDEKKRREEVNALLNYYGRNAQVTNPYFYKSYGAKNPFETAAQGGIMGYKQGESIVPPARQIEGGVIELDARKTGGYIPYGKKERVDDVPAMLAKDEFVFTSRAVKAAGGGSARRGAAKMYAIMKQLEGARA